MHQASNPPCKQKKNHTSEMSTQASEVQALGKQPQVEAETLLMTSRDESREEVPAPTPSLAAPKQRVRVAAWNVRTMYKSGKASQVTSEMRYNINLLPQSSQLAEPTWTDPGIKSGISVRELIST